MPLTDKEKRFIVSPQSFSTSQRKTTKFRTRKKIQDVMCDIQFLLNNHSKVYDTFGINVLYNNKSSENKSTSKETHTEIQSTKDKYSDPDLL